MSTAPQPKDSAPKISFFLRPHSKGKSRKRRKAHFEHRSERWGQKQRGCPEPAEKHLSRKAIGQSDNVFGEQKKRNIKMEERNLKIKTTTT